SGADVEEVAEGMGLDTRIGPKFLNAGIGFGGFCFPKDVAAFIKISEELGYDFSILKAVEKVNNEQVDHYLSKIKSKLKNLKGKTIGVLGLAFKPNTDDMRFAPSIPIIRNLTENGVKIRAFDPEAMVKAKEVFPKITYCKDAYDAAKNADCLLVLTEWNEFKEMDLVRLKRVLNKPIVIDGRNIYKPKQMKKLGIEYVSMGRE
ncbi:MAG: UDP-glucose/GDP-mannose dehydrogenase family protein, partial [Candidatus Omnitrophica bacterium]|nr:UDP-glucose/GDP-mannose dehydrogenase family protein [Candidatus Omnitrophota bacterium]